MQTLAAQYVRMSTEHQNYSIPNQLEAISRYAREHGHAVVKTYADEGVSGLRLEGRRGLKSLLADVLSGSAEFSIILVFDVSRWGRFQDPDQSAHYEFVCKQAGVRIEYVAEAFTNDGTLAATLTKHLKRAMAAEFSRELSSKVSVGKRRLAAEGFWMGGPAGYGLRRRTVMPDGSAGPVIPTGQQKAMNQRVVLVPGPAEEVATVGRIFRLFVVGGMSRAEISRTLNRETIPAAGNGAWTPHRVQEVLTNEKYLGTAVFGRVVGRLGGPARRQPRTSWVTVPGAFPQLIDQAYFDLAQRQMRGRNLRRTDEELLDDLRRLLAAEGRLSADIIDEAEGVACACVYRSRFGGLVAAYDRIGHSGTARQRTMARIARRDTPHRFRHHAQPRRDEDLVADLRRLLARKGRLSVELINGADDLEHSEAYRKRFGGMRRVYALAGFAPSDRQEVAMDRHGGQTISRLEAARLCEAANRAVP